MKRLVLLVLVVLLAAAGVGTYYASVVRPRPGAELTECKSNLAKLAKALDKYNQEHKRYPELLQALVPSYLSEPLRCPKSGPNDSYGYQVAQDAYTLICTGERHRDAGLRAPDYPKFTSRDGLLPSPGGI